MTSPLKKIVAGVVALAIVGGAAWWAYQQFVVPRPEDMAAAVDLNSRGIGLMEQFKYEEAAELFRQVVKHAPGWEAGPINLSIALLNQDRPPQFDEALAILNKHLQTHPDSNHADFCLGIIYTHTGRDMPAGIKHFEAVAKRDPNDAHTWFFLGTNLSQLENVDRAKTCFEKVAELDPYIAGSFNALQLMYRRAGDEKKANELLGRFQDLMQSKWGSLADKKYGEMGKYAEVIGRSFRDMTPPTGPLPIFVKDDKFQVELGDGVRWASESDFGAGPEGDLRRAIRKRFGGTMVMIDANQDGKLDLFLASAVIRNGKLGDLLLSNQGGGKFRDVTVEAGLADLPASLGCCVADFDNDGRPDLLLTGVSGVRLLRNDAAAKAVHFLDVTKTAGLDSLTGVCLGAAFVDLDQDSDLDVIVGQLAPTVPRALASLQNKAREADEPGLFVFLNVGEAPPNSTPEKPLPLTPKFQCENVIKDYSLAACNIAVGDLDSDRDVDVLVFGDGPPPLAILNDRLLKFHTRELREGPVAKKIWTWNGAAILDANRDERSDLFIVGPGEKPLFLIQGTAAKEKWLQEGDTNAPPMLQAQAVDLDLDGSTDIVGLSEERLPVFLQNQGGKLTHIKEGLGTSLDWPKNIAAVLAADVDGRCHHDFFVWSESDGLRLYRNQGNGNYGLPVELTGRRDKGTNLRCNGDAIGARVAAQVKDHFTTIELATLQGGLGQSRMPLLLGLGKADHADFVSIRWPDGIWQAELNATACQRQVIAEWNRKTISCPILFTWNGRAFEYLTDFLGAGSIGEPLPGGGHRPPRPEESVKIEAHQLVPKDGRYLMKIAEPMDEATYLDRLRLVVVDHPVDVRVFPDERFQSESRSATQDLLAFSEKQQVFANSAKDHRGRDVTHVLRHWDRNTADGFAKRSWIGFAEEHYVELDFGDQLAKFGPRTVQPLTPGPSPQGSEGRKLVMFLAGWTDYPYPESIFAAKQAGIEMAAPVLERFGDDGKWHVLRDDFSFPAGLPRMMTYDVTGLVSGPTCKLRIRTNMHVYWDQIFIAPITERIGANDAQPKAASMRLQTLDVTHATLESRGCMQEFSPDGKEPTVYSYERLDKVPVTRLAGKLTKLGDVTELLTERDDHFVIFGPGDELSVSFDATKLPPLADGWKRSFVLRTWGYCKDASPWTATGGTVEPLPFHGMSNFPYGPKERFPQEDYQRKWNTR